MDDEIVVVDSGAGEGSADEAGADEGQGEEVPPLEAAQSPQRYFMGETLHFDGGEGCNNAKLNVVTKTLAAELDEAGWSGERWVDEDSWPEDFADSELLIDFGLDELLSDAATLAVYAGHGNAGSWQWGTPSPSGTCSLSLNTSMRMGSMAGDQATVLMSLTSCTGRADTVWAGLGQTSRVRQILAYHNSPIITRNQARDFLRASQSLSDRAAWLTVMANRVGVGHNSPSIFTLGLTPDDALAYHASARLHGLVGLSAPPESSEGFALSYLDYGCGPCGCDDQAPVWLSPKAASAKVGEQAGTLPNTFARLSIAAPARTPQALAERAGAVAALLGLSVDATQLLTWAEQAVARGEFHGLGLTSEEGEAAALFYAAEDDALLAVVERAIASAPEQDALPDSQARQQAAERFAALLGELESRGLSATLDSQEPEVGALRTIAGAVGVAGEISFEHTQGWRFGAHASRGGIPILDAGVSALIGRDGRPEVIQLFDVETTVAEHASVFVDGPDLSERWLDAVNDAAESEPDWVFIDSVRWAYLRDASEGAVTVEPRLIVSQVLGYDGPQGVVPSRQLVVALSPQGTP
ncbi:hypothetical protein G6O69_26670 [Pseudenhygromyxa sp. WMMC2535]|uniref:hypothetical protein n=1 Tax=Pseudenhygromyxa sp. WMMC2535 TaxID=2712867 RepID=UPI001553D6B4|nr:hypothetical protein [Pseudenhygromyxa sp. WMMC2535]NVB41451.1 hypothetical protein [Pseudenhygromyxa sp. WMMC2535]